LEKGKILAHNFVSLQISFQHELLFGILALQYMPGGILTALRKVQLSGQILRKQQSSS